jgi:hypothetical protein
MFTWSFCGALRRALCVTRLCAFNPGTDSFSFWSRLGAAFLNFFLCLLNHFAGVILSGTVNEDYGLGVQKRQKQKPVLAAFHPLSNATLLWNTLISGTRNTHEFFIWKRDIQFKKNVFLGPCVWYWKLYLIFFFAVFKRHELGKNWFTCIT